jgi:hypothetical protein
VSNDKVRLLEIFERDPTKEINQTVVSKIWIR